MLIMEAALSLIQEILKEIVLQKEASGFGQLLCIIYEDMILNKISKNRYENFDELTTTMINEFVEKIIVHKRDRKSSQTAKQKIEIYLIMNRQRKN